MGNHDIGYWELAAAPYGPPVEDRDLIACSSFCFDPTTGSWLAQSFLNAILPRTYIPPTSHKIASPCWPRVPLLRDARSHFLLRDLCTDCGLDPDFEPHGDEWQPFDLLALGYKDLIEQREKNQEEVDGKYTDMGQKGDSGETWNETEEYVNFFHIWPVPMVTIEKNSQFEFSKEAIKQVSTVSLMPAPDTIRLVTKRLNTTIRDFRDAYSPQLDLPSAFSDTTVSSNYSSEGSYVSNLFYRGDDQTEEHAALMSEVDNRLPASTMPSFETVTDTDPSVLEAIPLGNVEAGVDHPSLTSLRSYMSSESVFDNEPGESVQPSSDVNDPNVVSMRTFLLDSEDDNDQNNFSDEINQIFRPLSKTISQTTILKVTDTNFDDLYEYTTNGITKQNAPNSAPPITTAAIDAAEQSLIFHLNLANTSYPNLELHLSTEPDFAPDQTLPLDFTTPVTNADATVGKHHPSTHTPRMRRSSLVSINLNTARRSTDIPMGLGSWIVHGARKVIRLMRKMNCACAGADTEV